MTITVQYSCYPCGVSRRPIQVPARRPGEHVLAWTNATVRAVARDHFGEYPDCPANSLSELLIPMTGTSQIGGPVEH